ncbi:MAG: hypothetical protein G8237_12405 [Magnetococcales bacterium]|nr:hypothetical protein [Magnetococcales bacterium]NGZ07144.1 hypothetical protein [Magnetococcales bacterium]
MPERDLYTSEQLAKIRATLAEALGENARQALENLDTRFVAAQELPDAPQKGGGGGSSGSSPGRKSSSMSSSHDDEKKHSVDVESVIQEGRLKKMLETLGKIQDEPSQVRTMIAEILRHKEVKAFHMVDAMSKVTGDVELVNALAHGIVSHKGVNPLIDGLRHATISPEAMKSLAMGVADQGTINHVIRAIATAPPDQPEAEIIWAMEVMGRGTMEQMLEAIKLMNNTSPGTTILATGIVNRKDVAIEPLVRAMTATKGNAKATALLAVALTKLADTPSLVTLLEKYVSDDTDAGEILTAKLVQRSLSVAEKERPKLMARAARMMRGNSMAGKILAMGLVQQGDPQQLEAAFQRINHTTGREILACGIAKKMSAFAAMRLLGGDYFKLSKMQASADVAVREAKQRYEWVIYTLLGEVPESQKPTLSAREALAKGL